MCQSATPNFCSCQQVSTQVVGGVLAAAQHQIIFVWQILLAWGSPTWGMGGSVTKRQLLHVPTTLPIWTSRTRGFSGGTQDCSSVASFAQKTLKA